MVKIVSISAEGPDDYIVRIAVSGEVDEHSFVFHIHTLEGGVRLVQAPEKFFRLVSGHYHPYGAVTAAVGAFDRASLELRDAEPPRADAIRRSTVVSDV